MARRQPGQVDDWGSHLWQSLPDDHFVSENKSYTVLQIRRSLDGTNSCVYERETIARDLVRGWAHNATLAQRDVVLTPTFQCLVVSTHDFNDFPVDISRDDLLYVADVLGMPPLQSQLLFAPYSGHVVFDRRVQWYSGRPGLRAIASTDPATGRTTAIVTVNESGQNAFEEDLRQFSRVVEHPLMLALAIRVNTFKVVHELAQNFVSSLRHAEQLSGFHAEYEEDSGEENMNEGNDIPRLNLGKLSKKVASDATNLGNMKVILAGLVSMHDMLHLDDGQLKWQMHFRARPGNSYTAQSEDIIEIDAVFESMKQSLLTAVTEYQARARDLQSVLFNLIANADSYAGIQLAKDSRTIASATRKDGQSMKTIAIMTMIFLPGTFYSSLFAVPTLQWDQSPVIQHRFWVYWAFTVPSTILILSAWYVLGRLRSTQGQDRINNIHRSDAPARPGLFDFAGFLWYRATGPRASSGRAPNNRAFMRGRDDLRSRPCEASTAAEAKRQGSDRHDRPDATSREEQGCTMVRDHVGGQDHSTADNMA